MADEKIKPAGPTYIHGIGSSTAIDTASEIVDLAGLDCSSLVGGPFSWEHKNDQPNQLVGKILEYKKIFSEKDCENENHKYFWDKCKVPYLYVMGRLFDDKKDSSRECAALFLDDAEHPDEHPMVGFSVEGSKISKVGMVVDKSIARRVTVTNCPANKTCVAEIVKNTDAEKSTTDTDSIFKSEASFTIELLEKSDKLNAPVFSNVKGSQMRSGSPGLKEGMGTSHMGSHVRRGLQGGQVQDTTRAREIARKQLKQIQNTTKPNLDKAEVPGSKFPASQPAKGPSKAVKGAPGWQHTGGGNFSHPEHGVVSVVKEGSQFNVKHGGGLAGVGGKKGSFGTAQEAGAHAGNYIRSLGQGKTQAPAMHNRPSPSMDKSLMGGMMGAGLPQESTDKKNKRGLFNPDVDKISGRGMMIGGMGKAETGYEKGVATKPNPKFKEGISGSGINVRLKDTGKAKKDSIGRMMQQEKIKPKLVASEKNGNLKKAMTAGSGMASPGSLTGGAALAPESLDRKMKKAQWLARAEEAYNTWTKKEQFENFMAKHMPTLAKGEIQALGQILALRKSLRAEKKLAGMVTDQGQDSWVKKKE